MGRILYLVRVFSNGVSSFLKARRAIKMTNIQVDLSLFQLPKQWPKSMKLYAEIVL